MNSLDAKPMKSLLYSRQHSSPMTSILVIIERISSNYLKDQNVFGKVLLSFLNLNKILNILKKANKTVLLKCLKGPVWEHPSAVNVLTGPKHCWNLHDSIDILFFHHLEINWVGKNISLSQTWNLKTVC